MASSQLSIAFDAATRDVLRQEAARRGVSASHLVRELVAARYASTLLRVRTEQPQHRDPPAPVPFEPPHA